MPAATSNTTMPARDFLNSFVEDLFIKDIQDNFDELIERKKDTDSHLLVEKYWIVFKKILDDADEIGYRENEKLKEFAIDISLRMIDIFVEVIHTNNIPEADLEEYCEHQIDLMVDIVKRYGIGDDYMEQVAGIICKYSENYVNDLNNLPFEEFYKYTKKKGLEKVDTYADFSMHQLGVRLYIDIISDFVDRFNADEDPQLRLYEEEFSYLMEKCDFFDFTQEEGVPDRIVSAACIFLEGGMERKYQDKEVMREVIKQFIAILTRFELINDVFWNVLTDTLTRYMKLMAENDERENLKFYWIFSREIEVLDRVAMTIEDAMSGAPASKPSTKSAKKPKKKKSTGGLKEL